MKKNLLVFGVLAVGFVAPVQADDAAAPVVEKPIVEKAATPTAIEKFGAAAKTYGALKTLRVRWREINALGGESIWELRWRKLSEDNAQLWVRGFDPKTKLNNTFVYDGKRFLHLRTDENELESEVLSPSAGLAKVFTASPTVFLSFAPLLAGVNFAADKSKVVGTNIEKNRVLLDAKLPNSTGLTQLGFGFDGANFLKEFSITRTISGIKATLRWEIQKQEPNAPLTDADFVLKAPPKPPKPKLALKIDPRAVASFAKATQLYSGLKSWSATLKRSIGNDTDINEMDLVKPTRLRLVNRGALPQTHFVNAGKHWILDTEFKTYQQATDDMKGPNPAVAILANAGAMNLEIGQWFLGKNPLSAAFAPQFYDGSLSVEAKRLADARLKNQLCERVLVIKREPKEGPLGATTVSETFWIRAQDGAILRIESRFEEQGEDPFISTDNFSQRFNPTLPASRFVFTPPRGYKKEK